MAPAITPLISQYENTRAQDPRINRKPGTWRTTALDHRGQGMAHTVAKSRPVAVG